MHFDFKNKRVKYALLAAVFALLIAGAAIAYPALTQQYEQTMQSQQPQPSETPDTSVPPTENAEAAEENGGSSGEEKQPSPENSSGAAVSPESSQKPAETKSPANTQSPAQTAKPSGASTPAPTRSPSPTSTPAPTRRPSPTSTPAPTSRPAQSAAPVSTPFPVPSTAPATEAPKKNTAPDFTVLDAYGSSVRLSGKFGKPIVINFWATWCSPCRQELPDLNRLYSEYGDRITFMMVNLTDGLRDTVEGTKSFVAQNGYTFPVYFDTSSSGANAYGVSSIPQTTFIDRNGNVYTTRIGSMNESTLRGYLDALLS